MRFYDNKKALRLIARRGVPFTLVFIFVWSMAGTAEAVSSWNPTLLVNTESFMEIDQGDGTSDVEFRFGDIDKKLMWLYDENRFQFTRNVNVGGNLTATGSISASGALTTSGALTVDGTSNLQGAVTFGGALNITEGALTDDTIVEADIKAVDSATDEDFLTYEATTGDFEWHSISDVSAGIAADIAEGELANDIILEEDLKAVDAASDEDILTYESTTGDFEWHSKSDLGIGTATAITDGLIVEPDLDADNAAADGDWLQYDETGTNFVWRSSAELLTDVGQNAGTDITADLEEETHASEHASGGGDAVDHDTLTNFVADEHIDWTAASDNFVTSGNVAASGSLSIEGTTSLKGALTLGDTITFPTADGTRGQVLTTDGAGNVVWSGSTLGVGSGGVVAISPEYPNAVYFESGAIATTIGQLSYDYDETNNENFYRWTSTKAALQEYWISVRVRIPDNFKQWDSARPIQFRYRTTDASTANNFITMRLYDTAGTQIALTGGNDLANTSWTTATITGPDASGTYTKGSYITVAIKMNTNSTGNADAGFINLNFETTAP